MPDSAKPVDAISLTHLPYSLDSGIAARARIGLITLASDHTIEHEWRDLVALPGVGLYHSRILNDPKITPESLRAMEARIADMARVILPGVALDVIAYGCTSASMVIGTDKIDILIRSARPEVKSTNPASAADVALKALGVKRLGLLTPYIEEVNATVRQFFVSAGYEVPVMGSFNNPDDNEVSRISQDSLRDACAQLAASADIDGVFISCTSLQLAKAVAGIEQDLGLPVTSSNHAMAWHALRLAGIPDQRENAGRLFKL